MSDDKKLSLPPIPVTSYDEDGVPPPSPPDEILSMLNNLEGLMKTLGFRFLREKSEIPFTVLQGDGRDPKWIGSSEGGYFWRYYQDEYLEVNRGVCTEKLLEELRAQILVLKGEELNIKSNENSGGRWLEEHGFSLQSRATFSVWVLGQMRVYKDKGGWVATHVLVTQSGRGSSPSEAIENLRGILDEIKKDADMGGDGQV